MKALNPNLFLTFFVLLPFGCATSGSKNPHADAAAAAAVAEQESALEKIRSESIHVECSVYFVGGASDSTSNCKRIDFALETTDEEEVARKNPDAKGSIDFPVPADGKGYRIIPKVPSRWTIEMIPATELHRGDSVRAILRR
jgi:hypothetical protein